MAHASSKQPKDAQTLEDVISDEAAELIARRKLLSLRTYLAPAVLATLISRAAMAQAASCNPAHCSPPGSCGPNGCPPIRGGNPPP